MNNSTSPFSNDLLKLWQELPNNLRITPEQARASLDTLKRWGIHLEVKDEMVVSAFSIAEFAARDYACERWAWAVPNEKAIQTLVEHSPVVEIGAGTGYWARLATEAGADVVAYDSRVGQRPNTKKKRHRWVKDCGAYFPVRRGGAGMARFHPDRSMFLCWPPYKLPMASRCLANYAGRAVIFVGELGGCTGDDAFHEALDRDWRIDRVVAIPQWIGLHDRMFVFKRKDTSDETTN